MRLKTAILIIFSLIMFSCENVWMKELLNQRIVSFNSNGGSYIPSQNLIGAEKASKPGDPVRPDYVFFGWYTDNNTFLYSWNFNISPREDMTLHAKWELMEITQAAITVTYPVGGDVPDFKADGSGSFTISAVTWTPAVTMFKKNEEYTAAVTLTADANRKFASWFTATINGYDADVTMNSGASVTLSCKFKATVPVTVTENGVTAEYNNLKDALDTITSGTYTVTIYKNQELEPYTFSGSAVIDLTFVSKSPVTVKLKSPGNLLSVRNPNLTLRLENDVTFEGITNNTTALIFSYGKAMFMNGGAIKNNVNNSSVGGLDLATDFTMTGGTISGNVGTWVGGVYSCGETFTMQGGVISGNTAINSDDSGAGGALMEGTTLIKTGGIIYGSDVGAPLWNRVVNSSGDFINSGYSGHAVFIESIGLGQMKVNTTSGTGHQLDTRIPGAAGGWFPVPPQGTLEYWLMELQINAVTGGTYSYTINKSENIVPQHLYYSGNKNIRIELNGGSSEKIITLKGNGTIFTITEGVTLVLGNNVTLKGHSANTSSLVHVSQGYTDPAELIMNAGAKITGNTHSNMGGTAGVSISNLGTFTMNGGEISGNTTPGDYRVGYATCGGVNVGYGGTFNMLGGKISGNKAPSYGGAVRITERGTFNMYGGEISGNTGAGVFLYGSSFNGHINPVMNMSGGEIFDNTDSGVYIYNGDLNISGTAIIRDNTAENGGGVYAIFSHLGYSVLTMTGGTIKDNKAVNGGGVYLTNDSTQASAAVTFTMSGGIISGNTASSYGGGVYAGGRGTFNMSGGEISGNTTTGSGGGGGVYVDNGGIINKSGGGTIYGSDVSDPLWNRSLQSGVMTPNAHCVYRYGGSYRNSTAWPADDVKSSVSGPAGGWE